ncbi:hypothetical protein ACNVED_09300 [Legionella sp. D16C41]|uniref:hypothetical protein n=1 Tax=Legionella sp. D16C41 TaxID=3402688 RepID=UPI003AF58A0F
MRGKHYYTRSRSRNNPISSQEQEKQSQGLDYETESSSSSKRKLITERKESTTKKVKVGGDGTKNQSRSLKSSESNESSSPAETGKKRARNGKQSGSSDLKKANQRHSLDFFAKRKAAQPNSHTLKNDKKQSLSKVSSQSESRQDLSEVSVAINASAEDSIVNDRCKQKAYVQIPSESDFAAFVGMPASAEEEDGSQDQHQRLTKIINFIKEKNFLPIKQTSDDMLENWQDLFKSIAQGNANAKRLFDKIDNNDPIKKALLATHTVAYVKAIIGKCVNPKQKADKFLDEDIHINNKTFEVLIKDIATTIHNFKDYNAVFNIGLPTHHAYSDRAAGYCIFNKVAILIHYFNYANNIICGLDVNADDGLRDTLSTSKQLTSSKVIHLDSYDPRVYPYFNPAVDPDSDLKPIEGNYNYVPLHLNDKDYIRRKAKDIHPLIEAMLKQIATACSQPDLQNTAIYLVLGWDSHIEEKAGCANDLFYKVDKRHDDEMIYRRLKLTEALKQRFNDRDFEYFYLKLREIINQHNIPFLYVSLEGGYTEAVNKKQTEMFIEKLILSQARPAESQVQKVSQQGIFKAKKEITKASFEVEAPLLSLDSFN